MSFNAIQFCKEYQIPYTAKGKNVSPGWIGVQCPFCSDKSNHGGIHIKTGKYSCWNCKENDIIKYIQVITGKTFDKALQIKKEYSGNNINHYIGIKRKSNVNKIELPGNESNINEPMFVKYLAKRSFSGNYLIDKYHIQGTGITGYWRYRIIIPIYHNGQLISFTSRDITDRQENRYQTLSADKSIMNPKHTLYGLSYCQDKNRICVVEGVFDTWRMGDGFCATLGTKVTEQQIKLLLNYKHITFMFDSELDAYNNARAAAEKIASHGNMVELYILHKGKDPADCNNIEAKAIRKELGFE
jgi:DNA primase